MPRREGLHLWQRWPLEPTEEAENVSCYNISKRNKTSSPTPLHPSKPNLRLFRNFSTVRKNFHVNGGINDAL